MSTSIGAFGLGGRKRQRSSRKASPRKLFSSAAVACVIAGSGWTVYSNIFAANVYPTMGSAGYDEPLVKPQPQVATRNATDAVREVFAALPRPAAVIAKPETVAAITPDMFNERFAASGRQGVASNAANAQPQVAAPKLAEAAPKLVEPAKPKTETPKLAAAPRSKDAAPVQVAAIAPPQRAVEPAPAQDAGSTIRDMAQRAKAAVMSITLADRDSITEKLWGTPQPKRSLLAFASADANVTASIAPSQNSATLGAQPRYERDTAVYDISAHMVYLPDGSKLEAHSGLGSELDDPRSARIRMRGVTPPHLYDLTPREALFHGVPALRLNPVGGEEAIYGRAGLLAHSFMLGPNGDSNGCVSFRDYNAFLNAYRNQGIKRLAVVEKID
jgi:type VI secretion system (T6SS) effector TldE1-like protein